jgi:MFS family permease
MKTKHFTLAVVCAATAMLMLDIAVVNTALSRIAEDLKTNLSGLQWIVDAYTLALLANAFPGERERAGALAAYGATIAGAFAIGPAVGGALTSGLDWQWIFLINVPIGIACLGITLTHVQESRDPAARRIDWAGQGTLAAGLFLLVLALLRGNDQGWTSAAIITELGAAAALLAAFVAVERKVREPMLPLGLFRVPAFTGAQLAAFAISGSFFAVFLYATLYLQQILGLSAIEAGLVYVPGTVVMFGVSAATANLSEKVHPGVLVSGGLALVSAGKRAPAPVVAPALVTEGC